ncbi:MAG: hypothetical protein R6V32_04640 [Bacteroidales bacterium]
MKTKKLMAIILPVIALLMGCQSESDMYGKWEIEEIQMKNNHKNTTLFGFIHEDYGYYKFTSDNDLLLYDENNELLKEEKYLLSEDGKELLVKGSVDEVAEIDINSKTGITLENDNCTVKLKRKEKT